MKLLPQAVSVEFERIVQAIERFNQAGLNPYGPNVPVGGHCPLLFKMEGPGIAVEFEFHPADRSAESAAFLASAPYFRTRRAVLHPMTRALIQRQ